MLCCTAERVPWTDKRLAASPPDPRKSKNSEHLSLPGFFFCKSCLFHRAPSSCREPVGWCHFLMARFTMQNCSQPGRAVRGTGQCCTLQLCLQLPHQLPSSTLPAWLRAAPAARDRSNGRRRRRRRREGRACLQFTSQNSPRSSCKLLKVLTGHPFVIWSSNRYMYPPKIHID